MRARRPGFRVWSGPAADIRHIQDIWEDALARSGGPWLFGERPSVADAMYAPVASRFLTYGVTPGGAGAAYQETLLAWAPMAEWMAEAEREPEALAEVEGDF
jgi:glutathione S-transferase